MASTLNHSTIYDNHELIVQDLPLTDALRKYHLNGSFPLLGNPDKDKKALIIGMFVLRPASAPYVTSLDVNLKSSENFSLGLYDPKLDWVYNFDGLDGGGLISNFNGVDAYRLGMQYGISDAIIIGSNTVATEGVTHGEISGYIWQPYGPLTWAQVTRIEPDMVNKVSELRKSWQDLGIISKRKYPANIVFTWSGKCYENCPDFLQARIFHEKHPDGDDIEVYIITSQKGAEEIKSRCSKFALDNRIDAMLIVIPPSSRSSNANELSEDIDISLIPEVLYRKYNIKLINHDGGQKVLKEFCRAGAITQMNLTLARKESLHEIITKLSTIPKESQDNFLKEFNNRIHYFFGASRDPISGSLNRGIPLDLKIASCIVDELDEVGIVTFDTRGGFNFCY